jgi:hypothetical protein
MMREKKAPHEGLERARGVQARLGLGGDKLDAPKCPNAVSSGLFRQFS